MYYDDLKIHIVTHRFFAPGDSRLFTTESNSVEFIRSGHIQLKRESDQKIIDLKAPAFYWMHCGKKYQYKALPLPSPQKYAEHIYMDFLGDRSERMIAALDELFPDGVFYPDRSEEISSLFFRMLQLYRIGWENNLAEIGYLLEKLMFTINQSAVPKTAEEEDMYGLERIAEQLRSDPFAEYDFHEIACRLKISPDHFRRIFRNKHHLPPQAYLHHQRMLRATELLKKNDMSIKEIIYSCNFKSFIDFSRMFKKYSGFSPREYRKMIWKKESENGNG